MIYVDSLMPTVKTLRWHHAESCHLFTVPGNLQLLHVFAIQMGLKRCWFQNKKGGMPHYDLTANKRALAVQMGAMELPREEVVKHIQAWREQK
jgi:hypothetical protein